MSQVSRARTVREEFLSVRRIACATLLCSCLTTSAHANSYVDTSPHELRVIDGDTLVYGATTYRLFAIDAPENGQPGSKEATRALKRMIDIYGIDSLKFTTKGKDRYGRTLAIFGGINCELVREGYAWA